MKNTNTTELQLCKKCYKMAKHSADTCPLDTNTTGQENIYGKRFCSTCGTYYAGDSHACTGQASVQPNTTEKQETIRKEFGEIVREFREKLFDADFAGDSEELAIWFSKKLNKMYKIGVFDGAKVQSELVNTLTQAVQKAQEEVIGDIFDDIDAYDKGSEAQVILIREEYNHIFDKYLPSGKAGGEK